MPKIAAYKIESAGDYVIVQRSANGKCAEVSADTFEEAARFLTEPQPDTLSIVWDLAKAYKALFSLLPEAEQKKFANAGKFWHGDVKVFWVGSLLGLTTKAPVEGAGNRAERVEVNLYSLNKWLAEDRSEPTVAELAGLGTQVLQVLSRWDIFPTKLTSPAGLYAATLDGKVPTIFSNEKILGAANACVPVMDLEWTEQWDTSVYAPTYRYDLRSAYSAQMMNLPDTDKCRVTFSKYKMACDWGILKVAKMNPPKLHPLVNIERDRYTTEELSWVKRHGGTYEILDGFYFQFQGPQNYPFRAPIGRLWEERRNTDSGIDVLSEVSKRTANGISGKLSQQNKDGKIGELYNPILAAMIKSRVRLKNMAFIEENNLQGELVAVHVDMVKSYKDLKLPEDAGMGGWRQVRE